MLTVLRDNRVGSFLATSIRLQLSAISRLSVVRVSSSEQQNEKSPTIRTFKMHASSRFSDDLFLTTKKARQLAQITLEIIAEW